MFIKPNLNGLLDQDWEDPTVSVTVKSAEKSELDCLLSILRVELMSKTAGEQPNTHTDMQTSKSACLRLLSTCAQLNNSGDFSANLRLLSHFYQIYTIYICICVYVYTCICICIVFLPFPGPLKEAFNLRVTAPSVSITTEATGVSFQ